MKKSAISLAVAAALPVAAQAGVTLSGSLSAEYTLGSNLSPITEAKLSAEASEVLANGMTTTVLFDVLGDENQGTVGLSGDFGEVKGGTAASSATANDADETSESINGIAYTGSLAGFSVNAAKGTWDHDSDDVPSDIQEYVTYGASYEFNGLTVTGQSTTKNTGTNATNEITASYAFGDLTVSGSKSSGPDAVVENAVVKAAYAVTRGDLAVTVSADSADDWDLEATYTMGDLAVTAKDDEEDGGVKLSAMYTSGDLSLEVDYDSKVTVAYDMGNADLSMTRDGSDTKVKYVVAF